MSVLNEYKDAMTVKEVAAALSVCEKSVYRLLKEHSLGCKRIGRKYLIPKCCVAEYLNSARYTVKR